MSVLSWLGRLFGTAPPSKPPVAVPRTWLQVPSLAPGDGFDIVGESKYQAKLEDLADGRHDRGTATRWVTVALEAEPDNPVDRRAVRVVSEGQVVGYVPKHQTHLFHPILSEMSGPCLARGRLTGGWDRGPNDRGTIGLVLDITTPPVRMGPDVAFLPFDTEVAVTGEEHCEPAEVALGVPFTAELRLADANPKRPKAAGPFILVYRDECLLGWLTPTMTDRYKDLVAELCRAGIPASARAVASEGKSAPQIRLGMPGTA